MRTLIAWLRLSIFAIIFTVGALTAFAVSYLPIRIADAHLANWISVIMSKLFLFVFNIKVICDNPRAMRRHRGLIFCNHDSFLDIILPCSVVPVRFLAAVEVRDRPVLGQLSRAVGNVHVDRERKESRKAARDAMTKLTDYPPVLIYPEGMLDGKPGIAPFRHGAFEIASNNEMSYMPVALLYDDFWTVRWKDESMFAPIMRLAKLKKLTARMIPLEPVSPKIDDDAVALAHSAERSILAALASADNTIFPDYAEVNADDKPEKPASSWETAASKSK